MNLEKSTSMKKQWQPKAGDTILAQGESYPFNDYMAGCNDNVLVVGGSGTGKTRSVVRPNILQATGSYVVSDPKGNLYDLYAQYLRAKGYRVERLDLVNPGKSTVRYNPFAYIHDDTDVYKVSHMMCETRAMAHADEFWEYTSEILMESLICYVREELPYGKRNLSEINRLIRMGHRCGEGDVSELDKLMTELKERNPASSAVRFYESIAVAPQRTWDSIMVSLSAKFACIETKDIMDLMRVDTVNLRKIGSRPTAIFLVVSDTDRSMDGVANVFFSQAMQVLCRVADERKGSRLEVPVRFILDDFATNVRIAEFPRIISSIRSRGISAMLMVQAEAQLEAGYDRDSATIISNCDTYLYLGGNDIDTAYAIGRRCDRPMMQILNMPIGSCWVFRRGQEARNTRTFALDPFEEERMAAVQERMQRVKKAHAIGDDTSGGMGRTAVLRRDGLASSGAQAAYVRNQVLKGA